MASNQRRIVKRVIEMENGKPVYNFGIFEAKYHGREMVAVVEGSYADAVALLKSERTVSGHSFKGFKKLKAV